MLIFLKAFTYLTFALLGSTVLCDTQASLARGGGVGLSVSVLSVSTSCSGFGC